MYLHPIYSNIFHSMIIKSSFKLKNASCSHTLEAMSLENFSLWDSLCPNRKYSELILISIKKFYTWDKFSILKPLHSGIISICYSNKSQGFYFSARLEAFSKKWIKVTYLLLYYKTIGLSHSLFSFTYTKCHSILHKFPLFLYISSSCDGILYLGKKHFLEKAEIIFSFVF